MATEAYAPGVLKLLGEYKVIWGGTAVAVAVNTYARATVEDNDDGNLSIVLKDLGAAAGISQVMLDWIYVAWKGRESVQAFIDSAKTYADRGWHDVFFQVLPYVVVASRLHNECNVNTYGKKITITSEISMKSGLGSSAACPTAMAVALLAASDITQEQLSQKGIADSDIIDMIRDAERILNRSDGAGKIDVATSYYGGCVSYSPLYGARQERMDSELSLVVADSDPRNPKPPTKESIAIVEANRNDPGKLGRATRATLDEIGRSAERGLDAIRHNEILGLGAHMRITHLLLRRLGVSTEKLDKFVDVCRDSGAYGAKLSGSGRGGIAVAITNAKYHLIAALREEGFEPKALSIAHDGANKYIRRAKQLSRMS